MEGCNQDYIFSIDGFFKREGKSLQTKKTQERTTENMTL